MTFEDAGFGDLFRQAQAMQERLAEAQEAAAQAEVVGQAGGGAVRITVTGGLEFRAVQIDPKAVDPDDVPMLEDLVLAALHDAADQLNTLGQEAVGGSLGGLDLGNLLGGLDLGGVDLGGLDLGGLTGAIDVDEEPGDRALGTGGEHGHGSDPTGPGPGEPGPSGPAPGA